MKLKVQTFGDGKFRGLWLHGWLGSGGEGAAMQAALGNDFSLLCPDLPGHGETLLEGWTLSETLRQISDLAEGCDWAGGYSMGGRLLMMAAARYPDAFKTLVIESASLGLENEKARIERKTADRQRAKKLKSQGLNTFCEEWYQMEMWGGFYDFPSREGDVAELAGALELFSVGSQPELRQWIQQTDARILWLAGEKDPVYAAQAAWVLEHTRHQIEVLDTGHNLHLQQPEGWSKSVTTFL